MTTESVDDLNPPRTPNTFDRADDLRKEWRENGTGPYAAPLPTAKTACPICKGSGLINDRICTNCDVNGEVAAPAPTEQPADHALRPESGSPVLAPRTVQPPPFPSPDIAVVVAGQGVGLDLIRAAQNIIARSFQADRPSDATIIGSLVALFSSAECRAALAARQAPKQGDAHQIMLAAGFQVQYDEETGVHTYSGVIENAERVLAARQVGAPDAGRDGARFVFEHSNPDMMLQIELQVLAGNMRRPIDWWCERIDAAIAQEKAS